MEPRAGSQLTAIELNRICILLSIAMQEAEEEQRFTPMLQEVKARRLAKLIYAEIAAITPTADRGVKFNPSFYELRNTNAPAVLVEVAFHDSAEDATWIMNNIENIGVALAKGVLKYFGIPYETPQRLVLIPHHDIIASRSEFIQRRKMQKYAEKLKTVGFDSIIKYD